ncbi:ATP-binding cassette domain-containing protein [Tessaracoccus sp. MC1865]|uniref:sulfate/molybdate ABC transporter ATP-binding protein n=1 Tax=Tessaracoccus sp. MC1865 TaxID=2760310 RepID=UPI0015FF647A|nr:ATP-binding cassette domain-containing protein [Tessaracoccus sp. MC1865]MBB1483874.1 ATP-binding cassette domain-containing protein [Tessaracoccus sp. MC1865]QTO36929.1 ATP-binding cassette domain-containing protein [Tessaracoccus sp. MC1865]
MTDAVRIEATVAARGLDLAVGIPEGGTVAVVGPNGAGKSSLIHLIAGSLAPDTGSVTMLGRTVSAPGRMLPAHRRRLGYLEQRALLFPHLTVLENVAYGPRSRGASKVEAQERAARELAEIGLGELGQRRPAQLSGGQAQRVALARALAIDPDVMLLDEPFAALDATVTPELRRLLRARLRGLTTVLVTHDFLDVVSLADHVIELGKGSVVGGGAVEDVAQGPSSEFLAHFVGLNLLRGVIDDDGALALGEGVAVAGLAEHGLTRGEARAVFPPTAVSVFRTAPHGSPRNVLPAVVELVEDRWPVQRVILRVAGHRLAADLTPEAVREMALAPGDRVLAVLKATQVALYQG